MAFSDNKTDIAPFVFYRMPHENNAFALFPDTVVQVKDLATWNFNAEGFMLAPFSLSKENPILFFSGKAEKMPLQVTNPAFFRQIMHTHENREEYTHLFHRFQNYIIQDRVSKIVLARSVSFPVSEFSAKHFFQTLATAYPEAFVFTTQCSNGEIWFGATPETLLRGNENKWQTAAIAGTMPHSQANEDLLQWQEKDKEEHLCVANFIEHTLKDFDLEMQRSSLKIISAGNVDHLHTAFSIQGSVAIGRLLTALHPTPAVCGFPTREALNLILTHEHPDRKYYSGFSGPVCQHEKAFFVNIRSGFYKNGIVTLYAGGGIMKDSVENREWQETKWKMQTLSKFFQPS